jgi:hypothetical protein
LHRSSSLLLIILIFFNKLRSKKEKKGKSAGLVQESAGREAGTGNPGAVTELPGPVVQGLHLVMGGLRRAAAASPACPARNFHHPVVPTTMHPGRIYARIVPSLNSTPKAFINA